LASTLRDWKLQVVPVVDAKLASTFGWGGSALRSEQPIATTATTANPIKLDWGFTDFLPRGMPHMSSDIHFG
jgi:hypothetical protein